ncbi:MAG: hypothetical protein Q9170_008357, partial [Blastenia crenularia]
MASQPPSQPSPQPATTTPPAPPISPSDTIPNDTAEDPSFDPTSLDQDIDMNVSPPPDSTQKPSTQLDGPADDINLDAENGDADEKLPLQKDISLKEFLERMEEYTPI